MAWFDEAHFYLLHHMDGWVRVRCLPGEEMAPRCTVGRVQAVGGGVMLLACPAGKPLVLWFMWMFSLPHTTYLNISADQVHSFLEIVFPIGHCCFSRIMRRAQWR